MAIFSKHLELIPADDNLLKQTSEIRDNIKARACVNLGFCSTNTLIRHRNLANIRSNERRNLSGDFSFNSLHGFNKILENYLITILQLPTISDIHRVNLTEHYKRRKVSISNNKILPSNNYCENLLFTNFKPWIGIYGTLGYYIALQEQYEEYLTPSQIIDISSKSLLDYVDNIQVQKLLFNNEDFIANNILELNSTFRNIIANDSIQADNELYFMLRRTIVQLKLSEIYSYLQFFESWIPKLMNWYLAPYSLNRNPNPPSAPTKSSELDAYNTLIDMAKVILNYGVNEDIFNGIRTKYLFQTYPLILNQVVPDLIRVRNRTAYNLTTTEPTNRIEELTQELLLGIPLITDEDLLRTSSITILESIIPPGGMNMLLILIAANLLNRAFIITHPTNTSNDTSLINNQIYKRAIVLIVKAGLILIKSSLSHIRTFGSNLISITNIELTDVDPSNILDA